MGFINSHTCWLWLLQSSPTWLITRKLPPMILKLCDASKQGVHRSETLCSIKSPKEPGSIYLFRIRMVKSKFRIVSVWHWKIMHASNWSGMTETSPDTLILNPKFGHKKAGSCGNVVPDTFIKIIDTDTGEALGSHRNGELCVKGPQVTISVNYILQFRKGRLIENAKCKIFLFDCFRLWKVITRMR